VEAGAHLGVGQRAVQHCREPWANEIEIESGSEIENGVSVDSAIVVQQSQH
jgi:hypothetical protein